jgi:hypothetical protein
MRKTITLAVAIGCLSFHAVSSGVAVRMAVLYELLVGSLSLAAVA